MQEMTIKTFEEYKQARIELVKAIDNAIDKYETARALELLEAICEYDERMLQVF